jgi:hypothetical protein
MGDATTAVFGVELTLVGIALSALPQNRLLTFAGVGLIAVGFLIVSAETVRSAATRRAPNRGT